MTSAGRGFGTTRGVKIEEKVAGVECGGIAVVTEIGLCREKNEAIWISKNVCQN